MHEMVMNILASVVEDAIASSPLFIGKNIRVFQASLPDSVE